MSRNKANNGDKKLMILIKEKTLEYERSKFEFKIQVSILCATRNSNYIALMFFSSKIKKCKLRTIVCISKLQMLDIFKNQIRFFYSHRSFAFKKNK